MKPGSLEHAYELIDLGFAVFPLNGKHPLTPNGFKDAVTSKDAAQELWSRPLSDGTVTEERATGVGVATGARSGVWVLDVDNKPGKASGDDTIEAWVEEHQPIPCAWEVLTPSGGKHLYFEYDAFNPVGTRAGVGPGIDVRGDGGYVVGPGSVFEGKEYAWEFACCPDEFEKVYSSPDWLLEKVRKPLSASIPKAATSEELRDMLKDGTLVRMLPDGSEYWMRPGKTRGEHSAVLHPPSSSFPEGMLHVFTDGWPGLPEGTYGTPADDGTNFLEDLTQRLERQEVEKHADGFKEWDFINLREVYTRGPMEPPTVLNREDGISLCYPGKLNYFFGPPECGKSWAAQLACVQAIRNGRPVVYMDFENDAIAILDRLTTMGLTIEQIETFFFYVNPTNMLRAEYFEKVQKAIDLLEPEVIVVDGVSNSMSFVPGPTGRPMSPLVHDDNLYFETRFLKKLLRTAEGEKRDKTALIAIDHTPKNDENATIFGGQHKKAQIDGASFFFSIKSSFGRDMDGRSMIVVDKDKPGYVRAHAAKPNYIGDLAIYSRGGSTSVLIELPVATMGDGFMPHRMMEKITAFLKENPGSEKAKIMDAVSGPAQHKEIALRSLMERQYVRNDLGLGKFWCNRLYFEDAFKQDVAVS